VNVEDLEKALQQLRLMKPLVLCLTNHVTMDFMANCLLSLGAAPIMSEDVREADELAQLCQAVYVNIGTLDDEFMARASSGIELAHAYQKPVIIDPVGAGATKIRTQSARSLLAHAEIVRGNASEIMALHDDHAKTLGVDSSHQVNDALHSAISLATTYQCVVVVSGARDFVTDGKQQAFLEFGSPLMPYVTGMGCAMTAVIAAFRAVIPNAYDAARAGTAYYSLCGSLAAYTTDHPGAFRTAFIDELYAANFELMKDVIHAD